MGSKKSSRGPVSKISSAADPAASGATIAGKKSSVLRSAFSPSEYQLALFASVIQGLDAQHLRIHDVNSGRLQCEHAAKPREVITSLDWGYYGDAHRDRDSMHLKKKRKRSSGVNGAVVDGPENGEVVVAFGTSSSEIRLYSPLEDKIVRTLSDGHERGIRDFKFTANRQGEGWSIGGDGKLVQWDLRSGKSIRVFTLPSTSVTALARPVPSDPPVLCASQTPYTISLNTENSNDGISFSAMKNSVHTLISSSTDLATLSEQFLAADSDRYINVFDTQKRKLLGSLVTDQEVEAVSFYCGPRKTRGKTNSGDARSDVFQKQLLAVVTRSGAIELFSKPFYHLGEAQSNGPASLKSLRKTMTRRSEATIKIIRPDKSRSTVSVVSVSFDGPDLVVAWAEGGVSLVFERIRWQHEDTEELAWQGEKEIMRTSSASALGSAMMNGVHQGKTQVDEHNAVVEKGGAADLAMDDAEDASSVSSDDEEEISDEEGGAVETQTTKKSDAATTNKQVTKSQQDAEDIDMADADDAEDEGGEPSFGDLIRSQAANEPIDVEAELEDSDGQAALVSSAKPSTTLQQLPSGVSLVTVLTQSLKTNDTALLETCFNTKDVNTVRGTIQRLDSSLAATLLHKLAERLGTRPGRYGHLLVWVQWTCVAHGGSIAGKPEVLKKMTSLFKVMDQRSASLSSLLLLKGKLDMLDAQLGLRRSLRGGRMGDAFGEDSEDEDGVIYVEGEEDLVESDEEGGKAGSNAVTRKGGLGLDSSIGGDEESDDGMPLAINGIASASEDEEEGSDDEGDVNLVDEEAEESEDDEGVSVDDDDEEDEDEEDEDEEDEGSMENFIADTDEEEEGSVVSSIVPDAAPPVSSKPASSKKKTLERGKAGI